MQFYIYIYIHDICIYGVVGCISFLVRQATQLQILQCYFFHKMRKIPWVQCFQISFSFYFCIYLYIHIIFNVYIYIYTTHVEVPRDVSCKDKSFDPWWTAWGLWIRWFAAFVFPTPVNPECRPMCLDTFDMIETYSTHFMNASSIDHNQREPVMGNSGWQSIHHVHTYMYIHVFSYMFCA